MRSRTSGTPVVAPREAPAPWPAHERTRVDHGEQPLFKEQRVAIRAGPYGGDDTGAGTSAHQSGGQFLLGLRGQGAEPDVDKLGAEGGAEGRLHSRHAGVVVGPAGDQDQQPHFEHETCELLR